MDLGTVTCEVFSPHVGEPFRVTYHVNEAIAFELVSATPHDHRTNALLSRTPFSLIFRGPKSPVLPQKIYRFEHEELGVFEIFAVPVGPDQLGMQYDVQFS